MKKHILKNLIVNGLILIGFVAVALTMLALGAPMNPTVIVCGTSYIYAAALAGPVLNQANQTK